MTYSLIQHVQDNVEELFVLPKTEDPLPQTVRCLHLGLCTPPFPSSLSQTEAEEGDSAVMESHKKEKKEVLSKRAKRRLADRTSQSSQESSIS